MGCIFSILSLILKIILGVTKLIAKIVALVLKLLVRMGLLIPLLYVGVGVGLWLSGNEHIAPETPGFTLYLIGLALLTVFCLFRSIKKAMDKHNAKYDERGKRIKK